MARLMKGEYDVLGVLEPYRFHTADICEWEATFPAAISHDDFTVFNPDFVHQTKRHESHHHISEKANSENN